VKFGNKLSRGKSSVVVVGGTVGGDADSRFEIRYYDKLDDR
jgi:hypothetical protein